MFFGKVVSELKNRLQYYLKLLSKKLTPGRYPLQKKDNLKNGVRVGSDLKIIRHLAPVLRQTFQNKVRRDDFCNRPYFQIYTEPNRANNE